MAKRFAVKPMYAYAILGVILLALSISVINYGNITGFATSGGIGESGVSNIITAESEEVELPPQPSCAANCGTQCWLISSGEPEGTFESSQGKIGILGCGNKCYGLKESSDQQLCCKHADCAESSPICSSDGKCEQSTQVSS